MIILFVAKLFKAHLLFRQALPEQPTKTLVMHMHLFENLDLHSKACITWKHGIHIGYRSEGSYYMSLYRVDNFYVEIHYHTCMDGIAAIQCFICEEQLHAYLEQVDISGLLN